MDGAKFYKKLQHAKDGCQYPEAMQQDEGEAPVKPNFTRNQDYSEILLFLHVWQHRPTAVKSKKVKEGGYLYVYWGTGTRQTEWQ